MKQRSAIRFNEWTLNVQVLFFPFENHPRELGHWVWLSFICIWIGPRFDVTDIYPSRWKTVGDDSRPQQTADESGFTATTPSWSWFKYFWLYMDVTVGITAAWLHQNAYTLSDDERARQDRPETKKWRRPLRKRIVAKVANERKKGGR